MESKVPNPPTHIDLALEGLQRLSHDAFEKHIGSFLLGCTAPDIRIITMRDRSDTHFVPLSVNIIGTGAQRMFQCHPELANIDSLSDSTIAFVAGYISHLVSDETWIIRMYRPYFGQEGVFDDEIQGNLMDRALQLEMDMRAARAGRGIDDVRDYLRGASEGVDVGFIEQDTLLRWQEWLMGVPQSRFTWERLRFMMRRQLPSALDDTAIMDRVDRFIDSLPEGLNEINARIPKEGLELYRQESINEWVRITKEFLS